MNDKYMTEEEYIDSVRKDREESVKFFSSDNRAERELWVANEFLSNLGLSFLEKELEHVTDDPPDVRFNKAEFEIKEILDPGRRRHAEFKNALERAKNAKTTQELLENYSPKDIIYTEIYDLVEEAVKKYSSKYSPEVRKTLDLLFYVNLEEVHGYIGAPLPTQDKLQSYGFRSVSFVMGPLSGVLMINENAPAFLSSGGPRVIRKNHNEY